MLDGLAAARVKEQTGSRPGADRERAWFGPDSGANPAALPLDYHWITTGSTGLPLALRRGCGAGSPGTVTPGRCFGILPPACAAGSC